MPDVEITRRDIDSLGEKLGALESGLTEPERALVVFLLALAEEALKQPGDTRRAPDGPDDQPVAVVTGVALPSIREQFDSAFTAERAGVKRSFLIPPSIGPMMPDQPQL